MEQSFQIGYFWRLIMVLLKCIRWPIFLIYYLVMVHGCVAYMYCGCKD
jgi:hypothetical protein